MSCDGGCSAGIGIAAVLGVLLFVSCCWVYWWRKRRQLVKSQALAVIRDRGPALSVKDRPGPQALSDKLAFKQPMVTSNRTAHSPIHAPPAQSGAGIGTRAMTTNLEQSGDGTVALAAHGAILAFPLTSTLGPGSIVPFSLYDRYHARQTVRPARERGRGAGAATMPATGRSELSACSPVQGLSSDHLSHGGGDGVTRVSADSDGRMGKQQPHVESGLRTQVGASVAAEPSSAEAASKASDAPVQRLTCFTPSTKIQLLPAGAGLPASCTSCADTVVVAATTISEPSSGRCLTGQESLVGFGSAWHHPSPLFVSNKAISLDRVATMPPHGRAQLGVGDAGAGGAAAAAARANASFGGSAATQQELRGSSASSNAVGIGQSVAPPQPGGGQQASSPLPAPHSLSRLPSHETGLQREHVGGHWVQLRQADTAAGGASSATLAAGGAPIFLVVATERRTHVAEATRASAAAASPERGVSWAL
jgi:hypothetical protein